MTTQNTAGKIILAVACLFSLQGCHRNDPAQAKDGPDGKPGFGLAQEKIKPMTLTPKEIADGWISLFDGQTTFGWTGEVNVSDRALQLGNSQPLQYSKEFVSFELQFEYKISGNKDQMVTLSPSPSEFFPLDIDPKSESWHRAVLRFIREDPDTWSSNTRFFGDLLPETTPFVSGEQKPTKHSKTQNVIRFHTHTMNSLSLRNIKVKPLDQK